MDISDSGSQEKAGQGEGGPGGPDADHLRDEEQELLAKLEEANRYVFYFSVCVCVCVCV